MDKNVIDAELFFRDAKRKIQKSKESNVAGYKKFHEYLGKTFMEGKPIEVIDGDVDEIDEVSLPEVTSWVQGKRNENS